MKNKYPGDRTVDIQQARAAASRYKQKGVMDRAAAMGGFEAVIEDAPEDNRKKYLKEALTEERAKATVTEAESRPLLLIPLEREILVETLDRKSRR